MNRKNKQVKFILFASLLVLPIPVLADNCSGLIDCFTNMRAATAAAIGLSLFGALVSMGLDFLPGIGTIKGGIEAFTGRDLITGQELSAWERALGVLPFAGAVIGGAASAARALDNFVDAVRAAENAADAARAADHVADAARAADRFADAGRAVDRIGDSGRAIDRIGDSGRGLSRSADEIGDAAAGMGRERVPHTKCTRAGEPVDVASGRMFSESIDFELPGPIPFAWGRIWFSDSHYDGPLGHGWHHRYDMGLWTDDGKNFVAIRYWDGRDIYFSKPGTDEKIFHRKERLELSRTNEFYILWDIESRLRYYFTPIAGTNAWKLVKIENTNRYNIFLEYNERHWLNRMVDSAGREIKIQHDEDGRILSVHVPGPQRRDRPFAAITYSYDDAGNLVRATNAVNENNTYEYNNHLLVKRILANGIAFYWRYDGESIGAKCIKTWGDDNFLRYDFKYSGDETIVTNSLGFDTLYTHRNGLVVRETDSRGATKTHIYNDYNELISESDPFNNTTYYEQDERGNNISVRYPDGTSVTTAYNDDLPVKGIDRNGNEWQWRYDENGNLTARILPTGSLLTHEYRDGLLASVTDQAGNTTRNTYDAGFNLANVIAPDETITSRLYDNLGRCIKFTDAKGNERWFVYDLKGRVIQVNEPDGNVRYISYDGVDNIISVRDREKETRFTYAQVSNLVAKEEGNTILRYHYNTEGYLTGVTNENGDEYRYVLDGGNEIIEETGFDQLTRQYIRDLAGRVTEVRQPGGNNIFYKYDVMNRISEIHYADGEQIVYGYSRAGQMTEATNSQVKLSFEYDALGRKIKERQGAYSVNSEYDNLDNRVRIRSDLGADIQLRYDAMGLVRTMESGAWQTAIQYDESGLELRRALPGNVTHEWTRDIDGQPVSQRVIAKGQERRKRDYRWQFNGRLEQLTDNQSGLSKFEYDIPGNLTEAVYGNGGRQYRIADAVSNYYKEPGATDRTYGRAGQLLESDTFGYRYDELGNLIEKTDRQGQQWKYRWYANGMLREVEKPTGDIIRFQYDALGRRIARQSPQGNRRWVWDGDKPLHEFAENRLREDNVDELITWIFEENGFSPAARLINNQSYSIINDHLGTPLEMYNGDGEKTWGHELDIYGNVRNPEGSASDCPFRYNGQYEDEETGLYYNRFRYYDPEAGIYISQDPIGLLGNDGLYSYVANPNYYVDIFGLNSGLGAVGEKYVRQLLTNTGNYSEIVSIQNNSGHGVDILAKNKTTGHWEAFEVKTTQTNKAPSMSKAQAAGAHDYTVNRLGRASAGSDWYKNLPAAERAKATQILNEINGQGGIKTAQKYEVFADAHRNVTSVNTKPWKIC